MRLCKRCYDLAVNGNFLDKAREMVKRGTWLCIFHKPLCGKEITSK